MKNYLKVGVCKMKRLISYDPFFKTMKRKGFSTYRLFKEGLNSATYYRIRDGESVNVDTIGKICQIMDCPVSDVMEYIPFLTDNTCEVNSHEDTNEINSYDDEN